MEHSGCEADDVIATLATRARDDGRAVDIMTTDKDYIQRLADPSMRLLNAGLAQDQRAGGSFCSISRGAPGRRQPSLGLHVSAVRHVSLTG
ncbi:hypothetical protein [Streptomyces sp. NPDC057966]|uniref:hypothetical protein n=1 Tax=Streptomyces sp. NPDC057966 TaxID=3346292 RepID=UPI0036EB0D1A